MPKKEMDGIKTLITGSDIIFHFKHPITLNSGEDLQLY